MKRLLLLSALIPILALTSCCRYRGMPMYWEREPINIKNDLEKKDMKKGTQLPEHSAR